MSCVNKSSREFKNLAAKYKVNDNTLELITHKYWIEKGSEDSFPSDIYIQAQLGNIPYEEHGEAIKKLWKTNYAAPKVFDTYEMAQEAIKVDRQYFPDEAIVMYKNNNNQYVVNIKEPVDNVIASIQKNFNNTGTLRSKENNTLDIDSSRAYTIDKIHELFNNFNADRTATPLANRAFKILKNLGLKVYFENQLPIGKVGAYIGNNTIILSKDYFENGSDNNKKAEVLLHETIHALTSYALSDDAKGKPKPLQDFKKDLEQIFKELQYNPTLKGEYGVNNIRDFVAELANPIFRQKIQAIDNDRKQSFWQRIIDAFKKLLGIHSSSPYYTRMMNTLDKALNAFDVKTYMEYNGLDKAFNKNGTDYDTFIKNQKELDDIKAKAIKDGTFMKAPNGNPTKLNEQQWLQVRTKAFKDWFGDWEKVALSSKFRESHDIPNSITSATYQGVYVSEAVFDPDMAPDGGTRIIMLDNEYIGEIPVLESKDKIKMSGSIGAATEIEEEYRGKGYGKKAHLALANIAKAEGKTLYSDSSNSDAEDALWKSLVKEGIAEVISENPKVGHWNHTTYRIINDKLPQADDIDSGDRNVSKVVDENGEPLVVYHGTKENFNAFSKEKLGKNTGALSAKKAFFAASNRDMAAFSYAGIDLGMSNQQFRDMMHSIDINYTDEDMGLSPEEPTIEDRIKSKYSSDFFNLESEYKDVLNEADKIIKTHKGEYKTEINQGEEWVTDMGLEDYKKEGFLISEEQEKEYNEGKTITISKPVTYADESTIDASRRLNTARAKEFINKYDNLTKKESDEIKKTKKEVHLKEGLHVKPLFLNIKNPKIDSDNGGEYRQERYSTRIQKAIDNKNDGGIIYDTKDPWPTDVYYFFEPNQVKSAEFNNGDFSRVNDNIDYDTLSTDDLKKELHNYVNTKLVGKVKSTDALNPFINSLSEKEITDIYDEILHNYDDTQLIVNKLRQLAKEKLSSNKQKNAVPTILKDTAFTQSRELQKSATVQSTLPTKNDTINIYAGTNENANLSNFAIRPFYPGVNFVKGDFKTVEGAFQAQKLGVLYNNKYDSPYQGEAGEILKKLENATGAEARRIGRSIQGLNNTEWDKNSSIEMKSLIKASFEQNPQAAQRLLATGEAKLTHKQDHGKWGTEFPRLLMEVRDELRKEHPEWIPSQSKPIASMSSIDSIAPKDYITPQLIEHMKSIGIDVNDRAAMEKYLKEHGYNNIEEAINDFLQPIPYGPDHPYHNEQKATEDERTEILSIIENNKYNKPGTDLVILENGKKSVLYVIDHPSYKVLKENQEEDRKNDVIADGFGIRNVYNVDNLTKEDVKEIIRDFGYKYRNSEGSLINRLQRFGVKREYLLSPDIIAFIKAVTSSNGGLVIRRRGQWEETNKGGNNRNGSKNKGIRKKNKGQFYLTPSGEVYGFVTPDGRMFLDETKINPEHPIHEYTHLWDRALMKINPLLWNRGVELMKQTSLWKAIEEDANYGTMWKAQGLSQEEIDNRIASEVHARFVGEGGTKLLENLAKEKGQEGIIAKLKDWILKAWKSLKATFSNWSEDEINKLTLKDFNHMTMRDFAYGINPNTVSDNINQESTLKEETTFNNDVFNDHAENSTDNKFSQNLILPLFGSLTDTSGTVTVDAEWKVPLLTTLENEIDVHNTHEKNKIIAEQMQNIIDATNMEDLKSKQDSIRKEKFDKSMAKYEKVNSQIARLYKGMTDEDRFWKDYPTNISMSDLKKEANLIFDGVSDMVSLIQRDGNYAIHQFWPDYKIPEGVDFSKLSRKEIFSTIGINTFLNVERDRVFSGQSHHLAKIDTDEHYCNVENILRFIHNNWDAMLLMGRDTFVLNEGMGLDSNYDNDGYYLVEKKTELNTNDTNENNDEDSIVETKGSEQEYWQVEFRTISVANSMTDLVRTAVHDCFLLDKNGNRLRDYISGEPLRVGTKQVIQSILRWTSGATTLSSMVEKLKEKEETDSWVKQLTDKLTDTTGKYTDLQSQFFTVFFKPFQKYSSGIVNTNGNITSIYVNDHPALTELMSTISAKARVGEMPLIGPFGINERVLGDWRTIEPRYSLNLHKILTQFPEVLRLTKLNKKSQRGYENLPIYKGSLSPMYIEERYFDEHGEHQNKHYKEDLLTPELKKKYSELLSIAAKTLGVDIKPSDIEKYMTMKSLETSLRHLYYITDILDKALDDKYSEETHFINWKTYNPLQPMGKYSIYGDVQGFLEPLIENLETSAVTSFYEDGKLYTSYTIPSFITKLLLKFRNLEGKDFESFMKDNYRDSEFFYHLDDDGEKVPNFFLLKALEDEEFRKNVFDHHVQLSYKGNSYMRNLLDLDFAMSTMTEYFSNSIKIKDGVMEEKEARWFNMPMPSNKPSFEFLRLPCPEGYSWESSDLVKFISEEGKSQYIIKEGAEFHKEILDGLMEMINMELSRIQTVRMRNKNKDTDDDFIKNFDKNGRKFCYFQYLNSYLENSSSDILNRTYIRDSEGNVDVEANNKLAKLLQEKIKGEEAIDEVTLHTLLEKAVYNYTNDRVHKILDKMEKNGIVEAARKIKGIVRSKYYSENELLFENEDKDFPYRNTYVKAAIEHFLWDNYFMSKNMLMLIIGDTAFYKDTEDLQKRLAQYHSPGLRGNVEATDYGDLEEHRKPRKVSDGVYRTVILKDFDKFISDTIDNIAAVFDSRIASAPDSEKQQWIELKEKLVGEDGEYRKINVADAQGYSCFTSRRKKDFMFGKWTPEGEKIYKKIIADKYTFGDVKAVFSSEKPFVFTHLKKNLGVKGAPITTMYCPFQAKNSEYLLMMADALTMNEKVPHANILRAIFNAMEDTAYDGRERGNNGKVSKVGEYNGKGIDTIQFESAIKSSLQGALDLNQFVDLPDGELKAYKYLMSHIYKDYKDFNPNETPDTYKPGTSYNTDTYVQEGPFEDFCIQQEVPEHFKEHSQAHGSQTRMIIPSDLDEYYDEKADKSDPNNIVYYSWTEPDGHKVRLTAKEFIKTYEDTISQNIEESLNRLYTDLYLRDEKGNPITNKKERNLVLSKILQEEILSSPRYGFDLAYACQVDSKTGEFILPKGDPIQSKRIEQLINSIIKSRINKQEIAGGPLVQVSSYGTSKRLHIRFNDKYGHVLPTKEEWEWKKKNHKLSIGETYSSYEAYLKDNQKGVAYYEVFASSWDDDMLSKFIDEKGNIDIKAIEETDPQLLEMISYRIPTEDKYSIAPVKIVGFLPRESSGIMFPFELTTVDDSDFDIDKRYIMRRDYRVIVSENKIKNLMLKIAMNSYKQHYPIKPENYTEKDKEILNKKKEQLKKKVESYYFIKDSENKEQYFDSMDKFMDSIYQQIINTKSLMMHCYTTIRPKQGKLYRDNKIIDMTWAVLTNPTSADKLLNPGGFDMPKKTGYMITAYKNSTMSWEALNKLSIDDLKKLSYTDKDLAWFDTQIQFYRQNAAAANLIGVFAVNKVAHAVLGNDGLSIDIDQLTASKPFMIANKKFSGKMLLDVRKDDKGRMVGKTLGSMVSASADAVKDPIMNLMNINMTTVNVLNTLLRLGVPFENAALFLSQKVVTDMLNEFSKGNLLGYTTINRVITDMINKYKKTYGFHDGDSIENEPLLINELLDGLRTRSYDTDYKVLLTMQKLLNIANVLRKASFVTRLNSISNSVGPLVLDNIIMRYRLNDFESSESPIYDNEGKQVGTKELLEKHPILNSFSKALDIAEEIFDDAPENSPAFKTILASLSKSTRSKIFNDKKLFGQLAMFYKSYILVQAGLIDPEDAKYGMKYMLGYKGADGTWKGFPADFMRMKAEGRYKDNDLIKAINSGVNMATGRPYLKVTVAGMETQTEELLKSAWTDLYKSNPKLSKFLFDYAFYRGGSGFSPKSFMSLVPVYVKQNLSRQLSNGKTVSYVDIFRHLPEVDPQSVMEQFIGNNWDNNKLVPLKGRKGSHYVYDFSHKTLMIDNKNDMNDVIGLDFIKTQIGNKTYLWAIDEATDFSDPEIPCYMYHMIEPLGNNHEYFEVHADSSKPMEETSTPMSDTEGYNSDLSASSPIEDAMDDIEQEPELDNKDMQNKINEFCSLVVKEMDSIFPSTKHTMKEAEGVYSTIKESLNKGDIKKWGRRLQNIFQQKGLNLSEEAAIKEFKKFC